VGRGSCAAAENAPTCTHTIVPINNSTRRRKISLRIKRLSFKRESRAQPHPALFTKNAFRFSNSEKAQLRFEDNARPFLATVQRSLPKVERVVLNALAEQMRLCRLIFGPAQCDGNAILRLRQFASSSPPPLSLRRAKGEADRRWNALSSVKERGSHGALRSTRWQSKYGFPA